MGVWQNLIVDDTPESEVARFTVEFTVTNVSDAARAAAGDIPAAEVRAAELTGWVDIGASELILPEKVADDLGFPDGGETRVTYADGRQVMRRIATNVRISLCGRSRLCDAVLLPERTDALFGAFVLERSICWWTRGIAGWSPATRTRRSRWSRSSRPHDRRAAAVTAADAERRANARGSRAR